MLEKVIAFLLLAVVWLTMVFLLVRRVQGERYSVFPPSRRIPPPPPRGQGEVPPPRRVTVAVELPERCSTASLYECPMYAYLREEEHGVTVHYCRAFDTVLHKAKNRFNVERCAACIAATIEKEGADE